MSSPHPKGRGSALRPPNRFGETHAEADLEHLADDPELIEELAESRTVYLPDASRSIVSENDSPDLPFRYSLNPYRGCQHGCSYCYARPTHEYLGLSAGLDFEEQVFVKHNAAGLLRDWLARDEYVPEPIMFSGVTDCYQPAERQYRITRACLQVALECRQPITIVTKNALVVRDLDILAEMAALRLIGVAISITTLRPELVADLEPRTSRPEARLRALRQLSGAGVPTRVMVAPIIPGLNDAEIPSVLKAASDAGAKSAGYTLLRLPYAVKPIFLDWLERTQPTHAERVEGLIRSTRDGQLNNSKFGTRMRGQGQIADQIRRTFEVFRHKYGLDTPQPPLDTSQFRPPLPASGQMRLF
ncbi:MAG: PA0069 family radical SAM protein [Planctomycetaceae bacterium]|nr:PA0069 family radical SAM protein [Planctomycetaceae bacterium]